MDSLDEITKSRGFVKHVFNFDDSSKTDMLNIMQYSTLALIPIIIANKLMQKYVPEADDEKSSLEILAEVLAQVIVMFLSILFIHRLITFVPTYSGDNYPNFQVSNIILAMLMILLSLQTKLGEKIAILVDRLMELWNGTNGTGSSGKKKDGKGNGNSNGNSNGNKGTAPVQQQLQMPPMPQITTPIQDLPQYGNGNGNNGLGNPYANSGMDDTGLGDLMAANAGVGNAFGSTFGGGW